MQIRIAHTVHKITRAAWPSRQPIRRGFGLVFLVAALFLAALIIGQLLKIPAVQLKTGITAPAGTAANVSGVPQPAFARRQTLAVGVNDGFERINPLFSANDGETDAVSLIFESLVVLDNQGQPAGQLASSWSYDAASHRLVFTLYPDHSFRDGRVVQSTDVLFTYQCALAASYDGPLQGRLAGIRSVTAGDTPAQVAFTLADWLDQPDYRLFTLGILKSDYYACSLDRVFEIRDKNLPPEGSGAFELVGQSAGQIVLRRRSGYGGSVRTIEIRQVASEDKYALLKNGDLDIVRSLWNTRMQERTDSLPGYLFHTFASSVDSYFLVNAEPQASNIIQRPSQRLAVLLSAAGRQLSALQQSSMQALAGQSLKLYYFQGIDDQVASSNRLKAEQIAETLRQAGLTVTPTGTDWPDLAARASKGNYDILLLPATSNSRLPRQVTILGESIQPGASAWITSYLSEVYITSKRLAQLTINPLGHPLAAAAGTWTDRIENVRFLDASGICFEEESS